jgi:hypothetical protein
MPLIEKSTDLASSRYRMAKTTRMDLLAPPVRRALRKRTPAPAKAAAEKTRNSHRAGS